MVDIMLVELVARELVGAAFQPELIDGDEGEEKALAAAVRAVAAHRRVRNIALDRVAYRAAMAAALICHSRPPDRKNVVEGNSVEVRVDIGCRANMKKKKHR